MVGTNILPIILRLLDCMKVMRPFKDMRKVVKCVLVEFSMTGTQTTDSTISDAINIINNGIRFMNTSPISDIIKLHLRLKSLRAKSKRATKSKY